MKRGNITKKFLSVCLLSLFFVNILYIFAIKGVSEENEYTKLDGETSREISSLYNGVTLTKYSLSSASKYRRQEFSTVEFNPAQKDLYLSVMCGGDWANQRKTVTSTVNTYNQNNEGKKALAAVNGDMWIMPGYHSRVEGAGHSYGGYSDAVVTKALTIPRGFTMYGGEIICTTHMIQETPYEGTFQSFGISSSGEALLGNIIASVNIRNKTQKQNTKADGINRLPANDAVVMYTDKGYASNYSLKDAKEIVIDCSYDYTVRHGETITGTVTAIVNPGDAKYSMAENRIILTARGSRLSDFIGYKVGDQISVSISVKDEYGKTDAWRTVTDCVGGHMPILIDGVDQALSGATNYPASILGIKGDGNVVMLTSYGRQGSTYSYGLYIYQLHDILKELGIKTAFLLDGGGSAAMVALNEEGYELTGRPCDKKADGSYGAERSVINCVVLSSGPDKAEFINADMAFETSSEFNRVGVSAEIKDVPKGTNEISIDISIESSLSFEKAILVKDDKSIDFKSVRLDKDNNGSRIYKILFSGNELSGEVRIDLTLSCNYSSMKFSSGLYEPCSVKLSDINMKTKDKTYYVLPFGEKSLYLEILTPFIPGDTDYDGKTGSLDVMLLMKSIAGWNVTLNSYVSDVNKDGRVDTEDVILLMKYLAGWDVKI